MKFILFGILLLQTVFVSVGEEIPSNRTRYYSRRKYRINSTTSTNSLEELTTDFQSTTNGPAALTLLDRRIAELKADRDRKIQELLSPYNKCGVLKVNTTVPWIVVLEHTDPTGRDKRKTVSKGVLIDNRHVLTTVSSIHNSHPFWVVSSVRLGDTTIWITENLVSKTLNHTRIGINHIYQHSSKDLAIIRLAQDVEFTDYIQPVCLPIDDNYNFREMYFHMCKRSKEEGQKFNVKLLSSMPLTPQDCETLFHRKNATFEASEFCSWDEYGDNCLGDVGGPLMANFNGRFILIGLNSYVLTQEGFNADGYPGVYVKVGAFLRWIKSIIAL